jgi:hypothetical protein
LASFKSRSSSPRALQRQLGQSTTVSGFSMLPSKLIIVRLSYKDVQSTFLMIRIEKSYEPVERSFWNKVRSSRMSCVQTAVQLEVDGEVAQSKI